MRATAVYDRTHLVDRSIATVQKNLMEGALLVIAVTAIQLMLDRGGEVDWFSSAETWLYLLITISGFWMFSVQIFCIVATTSAGTPLGMKMPK